MASIHISVTFRINTHVAQTVHEIHQRHRYALRSLAIRPLSRATHCGLSSSETENRNSIINPIVHSPNSLYSDRLCVSPRRMDSPQAERSKLSTTPCALMLLLCLLCPSVGVSGGDLPGPGYEVSML